MKPTVRSAPQGNRLNVWNILDYRAEVHRKEKLEALKEKSTYYDSILTETIAVMMGLEENHSTAMKEYKHEIFSVIFKDLIDYYKGK